MDNQHLVSAKVGPSEKYDSNLNLDQASLNEYSQEQSKHDLKSEARVRSQLNFV